MTRASERATGRSLRWYGGVAGGVGAILASLWLATRSEQPLAEQLGIAASDSLRCTPDADFSASYRLRLHTELKLNAAALIGDPRSRGQLLGSQAGLGARLRVRALERRENATVLGMQLDEIEPTSGANDATSELRAELGRPFYVELGEDCRIGQAGFAPELSAEAINRLQALTNGLSMVVADAAGKRSWSTREHDSVGEYAARYERSAGADARSFTKKRMAYLKVHAQLGPRFKEPLLVRVLSSQSPTTLDEESAWLARLESGDHVQITRSDATLVADLKTSLTLARIEQQAPLEVALASDLLWRQDREPPLAAVAQLAAPPDALKVLTLDDALARYAALLRSGEQGATAQAADFLALVLRAQPGLAHELMARLSRGQIPDDLESTLFLALELSGTAEAQVALIGGLSDEHAARNRARAAAALPDVPNPSHDTLLALSKTAREALAETKDETQLVRNSATYALGALEQRTREKNAQLSSGALSELREKLKQVRGPSDLTAALDAIGNSGNPAFIQDLKPHLESKDALVRAHAIEAMGHMDPAANKHVFRALIGEEQDPQIRGAIARTYADQARRAESLPPPEVVQGALDVLVREPDPRVRVQLIDLVGPACASDPQAMQTLAAQFKRESDPALLRQIGRYVPADKLGS